MIARFFCAEPRWPAWIVPRPASGTFDLAEEGDGLRAIALPVLDALGDEIDVVAWSASNERSWFLLRRMMTWLGEDFAELARYDLREPKAIAMYETPADWYRSDGRGLCCLDWTPRGFDYEALLPFETVRCSTAGLARRLEKTIAAASRMPFRIGVGIPTSDRRAAA